MNNNVSGIFSDRLEALIAAALQDGLLTDKERELLKRRAEKEGEDWDEVEMIIEARLAEMQTEKEILSAATPQMDAIELKDANELNSEGLRYYNSQNYEEAVKWWFKAAEHGHDYAQFNLGCCYCNGEGVSQNYEEAVKWFRKAAEQGQDAAQCKLGCCYFDGEGVSQNYEEAAKWFRKAAEQGHAIAQYNLGELFYSGRGVPQNDQKAREWWQKAAEQGDQDAIDCLNGKTPEDDEDDKDDSDVHEKTNIFEGDYYKKEKNIVIPEGVTVIAAKTCNFFEELENLTLPSTLVTIEKSAFYCCRQLKTVDFTRCKHLKEIGENAFAACEKLQNIVLPDSVTFIGQEAFARCTALRLVVLPASLEKLEDKVFKYCEKLEEVDFSLSTQLKRIGDETFDCCHKLQNIVLPDSVTFIGEGAFAGCTALRLVVLPASLEKLEDSVFSGCIKLEEVDFSLSTQLKRIGDETFARCGKLQNIVLPDSVTFIGHRAFAWCKALRLVVLPASLEKLEDNVFEFSNLDNLDMSKVTHLSTIPKGFGCTKTMMIPQGVTTIAASGFNNRSHVSSRRNEKLFLPSTLESYGYGNGRWEAIYLYAPQFEDLETLLESNYILYVLPQYLNVYKELWEALGKPNKNAEILPMPDEYLYYYDN